MAKNEKEREVLGGVGNELLWVVMMIANDSLHSLTHSSLFLSLSLSRARIMPRPHDALPAVARRPITADSKKQQRRSVQKQTVASMLRLRPPTVSVFQAAAASPDAKRSPSSAERHARRLAALRTTWNRVSSGKTPTAPLSAPAMRTLVRAVARREGIRTNITQKAAGIIARSALERMQFETLPAIASRIVSQLPESVRTDPRKLQHKFLATHITPVHFAGVVSSPLLKELQRAPARVAAELRHRAQRARDAKHALLRREIELLNQRDKEQGLALEERVQLGAKLAESLGTYVIPAHVAELKRCRLAHDRAQLDAQKLRDDRGAALESEAQKIRDDALPAAVHAFEQAEVEYTTVRHLRDEAKKDKADDYEELRKATKSAKRVFERAQTSLKGREARLAKIAEQQGKLPGAIEIAEARVQGCAQRLKRIEALVREDKMELKRVSEQTAQWKGEVDVAQPVDEAEPMDISDNEDGAAAAAAAQDEDAF